MNKPRKKGKYTDEVVARILQAIRLGATKRLAAGAGGINEQTLYDWMNRYPDFKQQVAEAEAAGSMALLARIHKASQETGAWQAAAWILERRYPQEYGRRVIQHEGGDQALEVRVIYDDEPGE